MKVSDYMSEAPVTVGNDSNYRDAFDIMHDKNLHHLPVTGPDGQVIGILTRRDLQLAARHFREASVEVSEVMNTPVVTVSSNAPLTAAAERMMTDRIGGLPVVDNGQLVGVITETDMLRALIELLRT